MNEWMMLHVSILCRITISRRIFKLVNTVVWKSYWGQSTELGRIFGARPAWWGQSYEWAKCSVTVPKCSVLFLASLLNSLHRQEIQGSRKCNKVQETCSIWHRMAGRRFLHLHFLQVEIFIRRKPLSSRYIFQVVTCTRNTVKMWACLFLLRHLRWRRATIYSNHTRGTTIPGMRIT